jgi:hypothetical protein
MDRQRRAANPGNYDEHGRIRSMGGILFEVPTCTTKLSQFCHGCGKTLKKPLSLRFHQCQCGLGPVQRDLYSAFLAAYLDPRQPDPSHAQYQRYWESAEARRAPKRRVSPDCESAVPPGAMWVKQRLTLHRKVAGDKSMTEQRLDGLRT